MGAAIPVVLKPGQDQVISAVDELETIAAFVEKVIFELLQPLDVSARDCPVQCFDLSNSPGVSVGGELPQLANQVQRHGNPGRKNVALKAPAW